MSHVVFFSHKKKGKIRISPLSFLFQPHPHHEVHSSDSTRAADSSPRCMKCQLRSAHMLHSSSWTAVSRHEHKQKSNSATTGAMIKFIREMFPSNARQSEVKKHAAEPLQLRPTPEKCCTVCSLCYNRSNVPDWLHVGSSSLLFGSYLFICRVFCAPGSFCWWR